MFGKNEIRKPAWERDGIAVPYAVKEVFLTIQGEGPFAGERALFVRMWGCNLRCYFCDTDFEGTWDNMRGTEILRRLHREAQDDGLVVFTGGEPLRQDLTPVIRMLLEETGATVQIETAGTIVPPKLQDFTRALAHMREDAHRLNYVVSPKTGKVHDMFYEVPNVYWKYIVSVNQLRDETDGLPCTSTQDAGKTLRLARPPGNSYVYLQPMDEYDIERNANNHALCGKLAIKHGYRVSVQVHKLLQLP